MKTFEKHTDVHAVNKQTSMSALTIGVLSAGACA